MYCILPVNIIKVAIRTGGYKPDCSRIFSGVTFWTFIATEKNRFMFFSFNSAITNSPDWENLSRINLGILLFVQTCVGG